MVLRGWLMVLRGWQLFLLLPDVVVHPIDADSPLYRITTPQQLKVPRPGRARRLRQGRGSRADSKGRGSEVPRPGRARRLRAGMAAQGADGLRHLWGGVRLKGRQEQHPSRRQRGAGLASSRTGGVRLEGRQRGSD